MSQIKVALAALSVIAVMAAVQVRSAEQTLVPAGSTWKYNDTGANLGTSWRATAFNDATWPSGPAQLGYGDGGEATVLSFGGNTSNRYITYYFRRAFTVSNPALLSALTLRFVRDDGIVIYVNGTEVTRSNMPTGTVTYTTRATTAIADADESAWYQVAVDPSVLVAGTNVIAVELHQQSPTSSDISFDLELRATDALPAAPTVTLLSPADGSVSNSSVMTFGAAVAAPAGLASATLYVGGPPSTVVFTGPAQVQDAQITADTPTTPNGSGSAINVDGQTPHAHGLLKFPSLIGAAGDQVPAGAIITSATLQLSCTNSGHVMRLYRLTQDWVEDEATWNQRALGVAWGSAGADGAASNAQVPVAGDCTTTGQRLVTVTRFVQEWSDGAPNYGVVFTDTGTDGIDFSSSESVTSPILTVVYKSGSAPVATASLSAASANVEFATTLPLGVSFWNVQVTDTLGRTSWAPSDFSVTVDSSAPNEPVLVSPADDSTGVVTSPQLAATVSNPDGGSLTATVSLRKAVAPEFTIIALPDTQHYSEAFPAIFTSQTQWIVNNKASRNIVFVTHEGDIVEHESLVSEWEAANTSMSILDGVVPYGMGPGNHDQPTTRYNQYFPYTRYQSQAWYGGHYGSLNDNNFQLFSGGGMDFIIVHMEFCPPAAAVTWASSKFQAYPNRIGIMTTHGYLNEAAQRTVSSCSNTQYLWDGLAVPNPNLHFMLSGHVHDESRRQDVANGHPVFQMLADFQDRASGGEGWLRILRFVPAEDTVYVQTYSPWLNRFESDANSEFALAFPMGGLFTNVGTVTVPSGSTASVTAGELEPNTEYEWRMTVTNSNGKRRTSPVWTFTTGAGVPNETPTAQDQSVTLSEDAGEVITLGATDPESTPLTLAIVSGPAHGVLTGTAPTFLYQPAANFNGTDSFTFRASDGHTTSNTATVSITVQPVNDPPLATGESYAVQSGSTLSIAAPGVLANDSDVDNAVLTTALVTSTSNGTLALAANGSFTYTPTGTSAGTDAFTYRASDGAATSNVVTVNITITAPPPPGPVFTAAFTSGQDSFTYVDDVFRGTSQPGYATGSRISSGGFSGGALRVYVGGVDGSTINNMSGGWRRTFTLTSPQALTLSFRYNLNQGADYESDENSQVLASLNGTLLGTSPNDYVARVVGDGNGGSSITTGWPLFTISLGTLPAGTHTLILGGYNNKKNNSSERTTILIDDVTVGP